MLHILFFIVRSTRACGAVFPQDCHCEDIVKGTDAKIQQLGACSQVVTYFVFYSAKHAGLRDEFSRKTAIAKIL